MPVSVDAVYQKVLALANKEQRGYITPLEFNLFANQAQLDIFEQYFYDIDQHKRIPRDTGSISDIPNNLRHKLRDFISYQNVVGGKIPRQTTAGDEVHVVGRILVHQGSTFGQKRYAEAKKIDADELNSILYSEFHKKGLIKNPVYIDNPTKDRDEHKIVVYGYDAPNNTVGVITQGGANSGVTAEVIIRPGGIRGSGSSAVRSPRVEWGYDVIAEKALYNASRSYNFELHGSEEPELVVKILELAGITLNKPGIVQIADQEDTKTIQQEKQ